MTTTDLLRGIAIFEKYQSDTNVCAEHDQIWLGPDAEIEIAKEDLEELELLGFFIDEDTDSWSHFT